MRSYILRDSASVSLVQYVEGGSLQLQLDACRRYPNDHYVLPTNSHLALVEKVLHVIEEEEESFRPGQRILPIDVTIDVAWPFANRDRLLAREALEHVLACVDAGHAAEV